MTAKQLLDGIDSITKQLAVFRISAHADRVAIDKSYDVLVELASLVKDTKGDELGDDNVPETVVVDAGDVGPVEDVLGDPTEPIG